LPFAEERPHVRGHEAGDVERALDAHVLGVSADVVAVVAAERAALCIASIARTSSAMPSFARAT
jgi:hypothetical protein